jgi:hypothetical protein
MYRPQLHMHKRRRERSRNGAGGDKTHNDGAGGPAVAAAVAAVHAAYATKEAADAASRDIQALCDAVTPYPADTTRCADAIRTVRELFGAWAKSWLTKQGPGGTGATSPFDSGAAFYTFVSGSYRLNVFSATTDIDMVLVTTAAVTRKAVFTDFVRVLNTHPGVTQLQVLADIRVPLISATIHGQDLDIMTVHLRSEELPDNPPALLLDYTWMNGLDDASVLCMNGPRVTEFLLRQYCAPDVAGHSIQSGAFCTAVRYLRLWARQRGVYGNKHGYLGGVNIALLVAWVADLLRGGGHTANAGTSNETLVALSAAHLVTGFFRIWAVWAPQRPVVLPGFEATAGDCPVWLARLDTDPATAPSTPLHVSAPCFPRSNTTYAATLHTAKVLQQEVQRAAAEVAARKWAAAAAPLAREMLQSVQQWLQIVVEVPDTPQGRLWQGYIEAQIRHLVLYLSTEELAIAKFRALPTWVPAASSSAPAAHRQAMFIAADPDNVVRMYTIHGSVHHALQYFLRMHVNDPGVSCVRPKTASVTVVGPVRTTDLDPAVLAALAKSQCDGGALEAAAAAEAAATAAAAAAMSPAEPAAAAPLASQARLRPQPQLVLGGAQQIQPPRQGGMPCAARLKLKLKLHGPGGPARALPPQVTAVRILRHESRWEVDCDVYVGPPVLLRHRDARGSACTRPMVCCEAALAPPPDRALLCTEVGRAAYAAAVQVSLQKNHGALLAFLANKTIGCWCTQSASCHAHILAAVATRLLAAPPAPAAPLAPAADLRPVVVRVRKHRRHRG